MKTGKTVTKNEIEDHLDNDNWIEVFQDGSAEDMLFVQGIAATDRTYSKAIAVEGQPSPLLIRLSAYVRATQRTACPVPAGSANEQKTDAAPRNTEEQLVRLLGLAIELIDVIEKNAGVSKLIDLSAGTGMTHISYSAFRREAGEFVKRNANADGSRASSDTVRRDVGNLIGGAK